MFVTSIIVKETQHPPPTAGSSRKGASSVLGCFFFLEISFENYVNAIKTPKFALKGRGGGGGGYDTFFFN